MKLFEMRWWWITQRPGLGGTIILDVPMDNWTNSKYRYVYCFFTGGRSFTKSSDFTRKEEQERPFFLLYRYHAPMAPDYPRREYLDMYLRMSRALRSVSNGFT